MDASSNIPGIGRAMEFQANSLANRGREAIDAAESGDTEKAAAQFEELFARQLVKELRKSLPEGFFGGGVGADAFESWMDEHLGAELAKEQALGVAGMIKAQLKRSAEGVLPGAEVLENPNLSTSELTGSATRKDKTVRAADLLRPSDLTGSAGATTTGDAGRES